MKYLLHTALFTGCLCASLFSQAQFSETLLDENFDDYQYDTKALSAGFDNQIRIIPNPGGQGAHLEIGSFFFHISIPSYINQLVYKNDETLQYDSLEATFVLDPNLANEPFRVYHKGNGNYQLESLFGHTLYYKDSLGQEFTKNITIKKFLDVWPGGDTWVQYNPDTKVLRMKWGKQSVYNLLGYFMRTEFHNTDCPISPVDPFIKVWDCFCNTTTNPKDCKPKLFIPFSPPLNFAIDNLVIKGFGKTVTGFGDAPEIQFKEKLIVKSVDFLGREIPDLANYKGPAIIMFSDGSREKRVF